MGFLASVFLPFLLALAVAGSAALLWRDALPRPLFFFALSFILVLGLHRVVQAVVEIGKIAWPGGGGYFLEYQAKPSGFEAVERQLTVEALAIAILVAALSYFLLAALRESMRR
jgi:hypothetical protein